MMKEEGSSDSNEMKMTIKKRKLNKCNNNVKLGCHFVGVLVGLITDACHTRCVSAADCSCRCGDCVHHAFFCTQYCLRGICRCG